MTAELADWTRPYFTPGGGDAHFFFVVYGPLPKELSISRSRYRCDGIPDGVELMSYGPDVRPEVVDQFRDGYLWERLLHDNPSLAGRIAAETECTIVQGAVSDPPDLNYLRNVVGLIQWMLDNDGAGLFDAHSFQWMDPSRWHRSVFDADGPSPQSHVWIMYSEDEEDGEAEWFHTRGMRVFGRPDLSVHDVRPEYREAVIEMIRRFIEYQALGGVVSEGEEIRLEGLPSGMTCHHRGDVDDPDFNNRHIEVEWPEGLKP
ncbi:MAG: hypothetical protein QNI99_13770 [Woeseiaceae bacterium]|nr:hypothetical protein [Woeseiaceae bacterium]